MYTRFAERQRWKTEIISMSETGIGGFKEVIFRVDGTAAFSMLKFESGVHRVQRVPETEASGRIHTSTRDCPRFCPRPQRSTSRYVPRTSR